MKPIKLFTLFFLLLIPMVLGASSDDSRSFSEAFSDGISKVTGVPGEYLQLPQLFYMVMLPTLAIITVTYAILEEVNLFKRTPQVNYILAIFLGLSALSSTILWKTTSFLIKIMGGWAFLLYTVIFIVSPLFHFYKKSESFYDIINTVRNRSNKSKPKIKNEYENYNIGYLESRKITLNNEIEKLHENLNRLKPLEQATGEEKSRIMSENLRLNNEIRKRKNELQKIERSIAEKKIHGEYQFQRDNKNNPTA